MSQIGISPWTKYVSEISRSLPQRSHTIRRNHDGNARNGSSRAVTRIVTYAQTRQAEISSDCPEVPPGLLPRLLAAWSLPMMPARLGRADILPPRDMVPLRRSIA